MKRPIPVEVGVLVDLEAQARGHGDVAVGIAVDEAAVGRETRRHGRVVGRERAGGGDVVVEAAFAAAHIGAAVAPQPRAELGEGLAVHRALAGLGHHVDDAADRLAAVHGAHRTAHDLDAVEVLGEEMGEVGRAVGRRGIVDGDAVDQHQHMVGIGAADEDRGLRAGAARLLHRDAGHGLQHLAGRPQLAPLHLFVGDDGDAGGDLLRIGRVAIGGHDHVGRHAHGFGLSQHGERRQQEQQTQDSTDKRHRTISQTAPRTRRVTARLTVPLDRPVHRKSDAIAGRSSGLRVSACTCLPGPKSSGTIGARYPLTAAGTAIDWPFRATRCSLLTSG